MHTVARGNQTRTPAVRARSTKTLYKKPDNDLRIVGSGIKRTRMGNETAGSGTVSNRPYTQARQVAHLLPGVVAVSDGGGTVRIVRGGRPCWTQASGERHRLSLSWGRKVSTW